MARKELSKSEIYRILIPIMLIVVGVLFCLGTISSFTNILSYIFGGLLIAIGLISLVIAIANKRTITDIEGLSNALLIAFGVFVIITRLITGLNSFILDFIPVLLIALGAIFLFDAILAKIQSRSMSIAAFIIELCIGVAALTLGILLLVLQDFGKYGMLTVGIILILYGVYALFLGIMATSKSKKKK